MLDDVDLLQSVIAPAIPHPFGEHAITGRPGHMRIGGQEGMRLAGFCRGRKRQEPVFEAALGR